jgi:excisionase family DNA binding protein
MDMNERPASTGWISTTQAASILGIGRAGVAKRIREGRLHAVRAGKRDYRVREADVRAMAEAAEVSGSGMPGHKRS